MTARAGEIVTCINGHALYRMVEDVNDGGIFFSGRFEVVDGQAPKPVPYQMIVECPRCAAPWADWMPGVVRIHFSDGWRPRLDG